jgi:hypothetical protein
MTRSVFFRPLQLIFVLIPIIGLAFEGRFNENKGQVKDFRGKAMPEVKFVLDAGGLQVFLLPHGLAYQFTHIQREATASDGKPLYPKHLLRPGDVKSIETARVDIKLKGGNPYPRITARGRSADYLNYYSSNVFDVHSYTEVTYHEVYPGIDWVLRCEYGKLKYDFVVRAGADPSVIALKFIYQDAIDIVTDDALQVRTRLGRITEEKPVSFQDGRVIKTKFILKKDELSFEVGRFDGSRTLLIDPSVVWATYYGGNNNDVARHCATDASGNVYLCGYSASTSSIAAGGFQNSYGGGGAIGGDAYLVKFNSSGTRLWATYYGGISDEIGESCAVDGSGNVYLCGNTQSNANISSGGFQNTFGGSALSGQQGGDAFLVKFNSSGVRLWATYYGGSADEVGQDCTVDGNGDVYLSGWTNSPNNIYFNGHQSSFGGGTHDGFIAKFDPAGALLWGTYYGGTAIDRDLVCSVNSTGDLYVSGNTRSTNNIASGGFQNSYGGSTGDGMLIKFSAGGVRQWATYYGGAQHDAVSGCCADPSGNVYLTGLSESSVGIASGGFQNTHGGGYYDAILVKFTPTGSRLWGTYYGDSGVDYGSGCVSDPTGDIYVVGCTGSSVNIAFGGAQNTYAGNGNTGLPGDAMILRFSPTGNRIWGSYFGGPGLEVGYGCALDGVSAIYLAGQTQSTMGIALNGHQNVYGAGQFGDGFLVKICSDSSPVMTVNSGSICSGHVFTLTPSGASSYTFPAGSSTVSPLVTTTYVVSGTGTNSCGSMMVSATSTVTVLPRPEVVLSGTPAVICAGEPVMLTVAGATNVLWSTGSNSTTILLSPASSTVVSVTGSNAAGCSASASYSVTVNACLGEKLNERSEQVLVYPNPSNGIIHMLKQSRREIPFRIYDVTGRVIHSGTLKDNETVLHFGDSVSGLYLLLIGDPGNEAIHKIQMQ